MQILAPMMDTSPIGMLADFADKIHEFNSNSWIKTLAITNNQHNEMQELRVEINELKDMLKGLQIQKLLTVLGRVP